jgi:phosphotriesterase-related protein
MTGRIMTVLGPIPPEELGVTLAHEHIFCDLSPLWQKPSDPSLERLVQKPVSRDDLEALRSNAVISKDNLHFLEVESVVEELMEFKAMGGSGLIEMSNADMGRDITVLKKVSQRVGVHIIAASGHYIEKFHPSYVSTDSIDTLASRIAHEVLKGIDGTEVKAGVIGEIGTSYPMTSQEEKVVRAAARAQLQTSAPLNIHLSYPRTEGLRIIKIFEEEGVSLQHVIFSHVDEAPMTPEFLEYHVRLAEKGIYLEYDDFGQKEHYPALGIVPVEDSERIEFLLKLIDQGYLDQILLSQDVCLKINLARYGGMGYTHILKNVVPMMKDAGISEQQINAMLVDNPRRALAF